jgi:hypothetical protein
VASLKTRLSRIWKRRFSDVHSAAMKIDVSIVCRVFWAATRAPSP